MGHLLEYTPCNMILLLCRKNELKYHKSFHENKSNQLYLAYALSNIEKLVCISLYRYLTYQQMVNEFRIARTQS